MAASDFVTLKNGPTVPLAPLLLLLKLEERLFSLRQDGDALLVQPPGQLTADDCASIRRWRWHLLALVAYEPPLVS